MENQDLKKLIDCYEDRSELEEKISGCTANIISSGLIGLCWMGAILGSHYLHNASGESAWETIGYASMIATFVFMGDAAYLSLVTYKKLGAERDKIKDRIQEIRKKC